MNSRRIALEAVVIALVFFVMETVLQHYKSSGLAAAPPAVVCPTIGRGPNQPIPFRELYMDQKYRVVKVLDGRLAQFVVLMPHGDGPSTLVDDYYPPELKEGWFCSGQICSAPAP